MSGAPMLPIEAMLAETTEALQVSRDRVAALEALLAERRIVSADEVAVKVAAIRAARDDEERDHA